MNDGKAAVDASACFMVALWIASGFVQTSKKTASTCAPESGVGLLPHLAMA